MASAARRVSSRSGGDLADDPDPQARARERLPVDDLVGQAQLGADLAHLVLEQRTQRLDQRELDVVRQPADVVVALDRRGAGAAARLHDVRVERPLDEKPDVIVRRASRSRRTTSDLGRRRLEHPDELAADRLALGLGIGHPRQRRRGSAPARPRCAARPRRRHEVLLHLLALACPQQPVVDEHTRQPVADRPLDERGRHRGVDAAGQPADRPPVADLLPDRRDRVLDDRGDRPARGDAGDVVQEAAQHLLAVRRVPDLGVVLQAGQPALPVLEGRDRPPAPTPPSP